MELIYGTRVKSIVVDDNELERLIEHVKDFDYSNDYYYELCGKYRNELPAVKNRRVYNDKNPMMSLEFLK
jgi:ABC-type Fe3+-hydroxamate transport system substrate-binding protein